jgi:hypothetical protein
LTCRPAVASNIAAVSSRASSHVGSRLAVASMAKMRRPRACGFTAWSAANAELVSARALRNASACSVGVSGRCCSCGAVGAPDVCWGAGVVRIVLRSWVIVGLHGLHTHTHTHTHTHGWRVRRDLARLVFGVASDAPCRSNRQGAAAAVSRSGSDGRSRKLWRLGRYAAALPWVANTASCLSRSCAAVSLVKNP